MGEWTAHIELPPGVQAPGAARQAALAELRARGVTDQDFLDAASIVVSELVSNAVLHGGGCLGLRLDVGDDGVVVGAADAAHDVPRRRAPGRDGGQGLALVELLSQRWGVQQFQGGKWVWALLR